MLYIAPASFASLYENSTPFPIVKEVILYIAPAMFVAVLEENIASFPTIVIEYCLSVCELLDDTRFFALHILTNE